MVRCNTQKLPPQDSVYQSYNTFKHVTKVVKKKTCDEMKNIGIVIPDWEFASDRKLMKEDSFHYT